MQSEISSANTSNSMIEVSRLKFDIKDSFFEKYNVYRIHSNKDLWKKIDDLTGFTASCGTSEEEGTFLYIMSDKNRHEVHNALEKKGIPFTHINTTRQIPGKLIINAICREKGFISLAGKNYWIEGVNFYDNKSLKHNIDIPEIWIEKDGSLSLHSVRFIRYRKKYSKLPAFKISGHSLVRTYSPDADTCFVRHGSPNARAKVLNYLNTNSDKYNFTRVAVIRRIRDVINRCFDGLIIASFDTVCDSVQFRSKKSAKAYKGIIDENIRKHFSGGVLSDVPEINEMYSIPNQGEARIKLVKDPEDYEDGQDEYEKSLDIQHITISTYEAAKKDRAKKNDPEKSDLLQSVSRACLVELAIKQDVKGNIDSFSAYLNELNDSASFFLRDGETYHYVRKTGMYLQFGSFDIMSVPDWVPDKLLDAEETHLILRGKSIIGLRETNISPLASENAGDEVFYRKGAVRNEKVRNELFGGFLDAHVFTGAGKTYYYSSIIGNGMNAIIRNADTLMEFVPYTKCDNYDWILPYIAVTYINAGNRYTKYPYPFKYLNEWIRANEI